MSRRFPKITVITCAIEPGCTGYIVPFLTSVYNANYPKQKLDVVIYDNGLSNRLRSWLKKNFSHAKIIRRGNNINFAKGINQAAKTAGGDYLFIANCDTSVADDLFTSLIDVAMMKNVGIVGPTVYSLNHKTKFSPLDIPVKHFSPQTGRIFPLSEHEMKTATKAIDVAWISGCGFLIKQKLWKKLGGFDPVFRAYWEDADLGWRVKQAGFRVMVVPKAKLWHAGSVVYGLDSPQKLYRLRLSLIYFISKHATLTGKIFFGIYTCLTCFVKLLKLAGGVASSEQRAYLTAVRDYIYEKES